MEGMKRLRSIEIDPKIIEEKLRSEFGTSYLEDTIPSENISHINIQEGQTQFFHGTSLMFM